jgi:type I restriction-modification system DNA methylase subunit
MNMENSTIIEKLGFERAVEKSDVTNTSEAQAMVLEQLKDIEIDKVYFCDDTEKSYPAVFIKEVKAFDKKSLKAIAQIHNQAWNYKKVLFLYVYNDTEIRIYNCAEKPFVHTNETDFEKELKPLELEQATISDKQKLKQVQQVFSAIAIDTGIIWTIEEAYYYRKKINEQRRVDKYLVVSLARLAKDLQNDGVKTKVIHKTILRSLFLLYLEDRGATDQKYYNSIKAGATKYFDILEDKDAAFKLFQALHQKFNGNVFTVDPGEKREIENKHLKKIKECLTSGFEDTGQTKLFEGWRLFNFKIISIELLSEIYENFLAELDANAKKRSGSFYTPSSLVELMLNDNLPVTKEHTKYNVKILDPTCGSGIFLVESFKRIVKRYENNHGLKKLTDYEKLKELLIKNIYGIEIDRLSINVAAFSLYLALLDNLEPKTLWQNKRLPLLIHDPDNKTINNQGNNLFRRDTLADTKDIESIDFDLVIGNPPFGTKNLSDNVRKYCDQHAFAKEMALPFLHKSLQFAKKGKVGLIFNTKVLTNTGGTYQNFRKWLFQECYVDRVYNFSILRKAPKDFGGQLFSGATVPISIVMFQRKAPENASDRIIYYSPKTFVKLNVLEGIVIDKSDVKYLPREECQKPDTKIWKATMWGKENDYKLISKIISQTITLEEFLEKNNDKWFPLRVGINGDKDHPDFIPDRIIDPRKIENYYTPKTASFPNAKHYRKIDSRLFNPPFSIIKKGQHEKRITASYIDYNSYCTTSCYIFNGPASSKEKKVLVSLLNSKITTYFLFMVSSSWGVEREQVFKTEILELPALIELLNDETVEEISNVFDKIIEIKQNDYPKKIDDLVQKIDNMIFESLYLSQRDLITINDSLNFGLDLFENKQKSKALLPALKTSEYAIMLCEELNNFLEGQSLFANPTVYLLDRSPLAMIKVTFRDTKKEIVISKENVSNELKPLDKKLWKKDASNIYFRKNLNYYDGDDVYIIRPNQRRFWTKSAALEDASELILEILTEK